MIGTVLTYSWPFLFIGLGLLLDFALPTNNDTEEANHG